MVVNNNFKLPYSIPLLSLHGILSQKALPLHDPPMATSASLVPIFQTPNLGPLISVKLNDSNYLLWISRFLPVLRSHDLMGIVNGSEPCPSKFQVTADGKLTDSFTPEFVLWLNSTLFENVLSLVYGLNISQQVWNLLTSRYALQSSPRVSHTKLQLQSMRQGSKSCNEFLRLAKTLSDQLAIVGKPDADDNLITYMINGLNSSYHAFVTSYSSVTRNASLF